MNSSVNSSSNLVKIGVILCPYTVRVLYKSPLDAKKLSSLFLNNCLYLRVINRLLYRVLEWSTISNVKGFLAVV